VLPSVGEDIPVYVCASPDFLPITGINIHRGCLALVERPATQNYVDLVERASRVVVLEGIANADNVGGAFRTAAAFGVDAMLLSPTCCDPLYRKAIRTSMAATLQLPFARVEPWPEALRTLQQGGFALVGLTPAPDAQSLDEFAIKPASREKVALLVGCEGDGLTEGVLNLADARLRIPITSAVDSLNLVVATGIALAWLTGLTKRTDLA
jgi:tRNA G18 (ribose-2'-O)-methylase SpoU